MRQYPKKLYTHMAAWLLIKIYCPLQLKELIPLTNRTPGGRYVALIANFINYNKQGLWYMQ